MRPLRVHGLLSQPWDVSILLSHTKRKLDGPAHARRMPLAGRPFLEGSHGMPGESHGQGSMVPSGLLYGRSAGTIIPDGGAVAPSSKHSPERASNNVMSPPTCSEPHANM